MIGHLKHMAEVRPSGPDKEAAQWALTEIERLRTIIKQYEAAHFETKDTIIEKCAQAAERHLDGVEAVGWLSSVAKSTAAAIRALRDKPL